MADSTNGVDALGARASKTGKNAKSTSGNSGWVVRPHGRLEQLADNLWWTWGSLPGMSLKRSMVLA